MARSGTTTRTSRSGPPLALVGAVALVLAAVLALVVFLGTRGGEELVAEGPSGARPEGGGVVVAEAAGETPRLHVYEDFQCPWCGVLEERAGADLLAAADAGEIGLTVTVMSFLDQNLRNDSSSRAAHAAMCAADAGAFPAYRAEVFAQQPEEGRGWTDDQLLGFAEVAGLEGDRLATFERCHAEGAYQGYVADMQERAGRDGVTGTPRVFVDDEELTEAELEALMSDEGALTEVLQERG